MQIAHMLGDDPPAAPPSPLEDCGPVGWKPSPLVVGGVGALLTFKGTGLLRLLGLAGLGYAVMKMKPADIPTLQDLVRVQLSGCRNCR